MADLFTDGRKAMIHKTRCNFTDFDEKTKLLSINFLNEFIANEHEQVCSLLFETKEKEYLFVQKGVRSFDTIETDEKIIKT